MRTMLTILKPFEVGTPPTEEEIEAVVRDNPDAINERDAIGRTPLFYAVFWEYRLVLRPLLASGRVDIDACDYRGASVLGVFAYLGTDEDFEAILAATSPKPTTIQLAIQVAARNKKWGRVKTLRQLLKQAA